MLDEVEAMCTKTPLALLDQAKCVTRPGEGSSIVSLIHRALVLVPRCRIRGLELPLWIAEGKSSNWREARNLLEGLKEASREHSLEGLEVSFLLATRLPRLHSGREHPGTRGTLGNCTSKEEALDVNKRPCMWFM